MKSMSNTSLSFGLVNIPVKLYKATESHSVEFHQHHGGGCGGPVGYGARTCKACEKPVEWSDIVKGHETDDGGVVIVTSDELAEIRDDTAPGIEVLQFVHADEIPPMILEAPHYLEPNMKASKGSLQGYALLRQVLEESQRVGIVRYVLRDTAHIGVLRVEGKTLVVQEMCWADEIRPADFSVLDKDVQLDPKAVKMAHGLVESMLGTFVHADYVDGYTERVRELVADKAAGVVVPAPADRGNDDGTADVSDLLAALTASVAAREEEKGTAKTRHPASGRRRRKTA